MAFELPSFLIPAGEKGPMSPSAVKRKQAIVDAMIKANAVTPENVGQGINALSRGIVANVRGGQADAGEAAGSAKAQAIIDALMGKGSEAGMGDYAGALADPWVQENPGMSAIAQAGYGQELKEADPAYQMGLEKMGLEMDALRNPVAKPPEVETFFDPVSGREVKKQWNPSTGEWDVQGGVKAPSDALVTVNTGDNSNKFNLESDALAAKRFDGIVADGQNATSFVGDLEALGEIGKHLNTGKGAEIMGALGPYAEMLGIDVGQLDEAQAYDAIVARMAPQMRPPGSGASSDFDARQFLKSLPSLGNTPEGNAIIAETFRAIQVAKQEAAKIARRAQKNEITWQEADELMSQIGDPFTAFNKYKQASEASGQSITPSDPFAKYGLTPPAGP